MNKLQIWTVTSQKRTMSTGSYLNIGMPEYPMPNGLVRKLVYHFLAVESFLLPIRTLHFFRNSFIPYLVALKILKAALPVSIHSLSICRGPERPNLSFIHSHSVQIIEPASCRCFLSPLKPSTVYFSF